jgi:hypothetical protein
MTMHIAIFFIGWFFGLMVMRLCQWSDRLNLWSNRKGVPFYSVVATFLILMAITIWGLVAGAG